MIKYKTVAGVYKYNFIKIEEGKNTFFKYTQIAD